MATWHVEHAQIRTLTVEGSHEWQPNLNTLQTTPKNTSGTELLTIKGSHERQLNLPMLPRCLQMPPRRLEMPDAPSSSSDLS